MTWAWVKKAALGRLKWFDFYRHDIDDIILAISGHFEELRDNERIIRRLGLMVVSPYTDRQFDIQKYWPIAGDDELKNQAKNYKRQSLLNQLRQHKLEQQKKQNANTD